MPDIKLAFPFDSEAGPVLVLIEYRVPLINAVAFVEAMDEVGHVRKRDGAWRRDDLLGAVALAQAMDKEGAGQGADAERAEQQAVDQRTAAEAVTGDKRQKSQGGRRGEPEHQAPREDRAQAAVSAT